MGGYFTPTTNTPISTTDHNTYVRDQVVTQFASAAARSSAVTAPVEGMVCYLADNNRLEVYTGAAWVPLRVASRAPMCLASRSTTQSIANNGSTEYLSFDTEVVDTDSMFAATSTTITIQTAGIYLVAGSATIALNATGIRALYLEINGAVVSEFDASGSGSVNFTPGTLSVVKSLAASDTVKLRAYQNSGGALNASAGAWLSAVYQGPT